MITFARLAFPCYILLTIVLGYCLSRTIKTWRLHASLFLTLLVVAIIARSLIGVVATATPAIVSVVYFEIELTRRRAIARREDSRNNRFATFPVRKWDCHTPLVVFNTDEYFFDEATVYEYIAGRSESERLRICESRAVFIEPVEAADLLLGGDGNIELPTAILLAIEDLNKAIRQCDPICWEQADIAVDIADLRERTSAYGAKKKDENEKAIAVCH